MNGKGSTKGGWYINYKIPFGKSINITIQASLAHDYLMPNGYVIVRGCENLPIYVGDVMLPMTARMQLHKIENKTFQCLEKVWLSVSTTVLTRN